MLNEEMFSLISEALSVAIKFSKRKSDRLYHSLLKDSCNALVALVISQYLEQTKPTDKSSRFEIVTKAFRELLEGNYTRLAEAMQKHNGDFEPAFRDYNRNLRPFIGEVQANAVKFGLEMLVPRTEEAIRKRNTQEIFL